MRFPFEQLPLVPAALLLVGLVVVLLRVGWARPANRALALFFATTACFNVVSFVGAAQTDRLALARAGAISDALGLVDAIFLVGFALAYLGEESRIPRAFVSTAPYLVAAAALFTLAIVQPELMRHWSQGLARPNPAGGVGDTPPGPLLVVDVLLDTAWLIVPILLLRAAMARTPSRAWRSDLLLATGIGLLFVFFDSTAMWRLATLVFTFGSGVVGALDVALATRASLAAALVLGAAWFAVRGPSDRRRAARLTFVVLAGAGVVRALLTATRGFETLGLSQPGLVQGLVFSFVFLAEPVIVAYAVLRHQLLDIDLKVKWTIQSGTIAAVFLAVFFIVAQVAQAFLQEALGWLMGAIAAGAMFFALTPLQRMAERLSENALPRTSPARISNEHHDAYRSAIRLALMRGAISKEEERELANLAQKLSIGAADAFELREQVEAQRARASST